MTQTIHFTEALRDKIADAWSAERDDWGTEFVDDYLERLNTVEIGALIVIDDEDEIDETLATPEELVTLAVDYYGWPDVELLEGAWVHANELDEGMLVEVDGHIHAVMDVIDPVRLGAGPSNIVWLALRDLELDEEDGAPVMWNNTVPADRRFELKSIDDLTEVTRGRD